jgi:hypothetical protein
MGFIVQFLLLSLKFEKATIYQLDCCFVVTKSKRDERRIRGK